MKVPKKIQNKMHKLANITAQAKLLSREIDDYFESKGYDIYELRSGSGNSLEELDYGNDITDEFVANMMAGKYEYCRV